jgi:hypothetical protein
MATQVTGNHLSAVGGVIQFIPFGSGGTGSGGSSGNIWVDVTDWAGSIVNFTDDVTDTGTWGYQGIDIPCQGFKYVANLVYDLSKPADTAQRAAVFGAGSSNVSMNASIQVSLFLGNGENYPESDTVAEWIFIPSAKVTFFHFLNDAGNKKMVRGRMEGISSSGYFHMPYDSARLQLYTSHLNQRGRSF